MNLQFLQERINQSGEKLNSLPLETIVVEKEAFKKAAVFIAHRAHRRSYSLLMPLRMQPQESN